MTYRALIAAAAMLAGQAAAQLPPALDPGAIQQQRIQEERRREELQRLQRQPVTDPIQREPGEEPAVQPAPDAVRFLVREIRFTPSEILSTEELEEVARDFRGRQLSFADLQTLVNRVNALYQAKGVVTAQAVIPPQDVSEGVVTVRLVEGRVGEISLEGNDSTRERYVTDRLSLEVSDLVDLPRLERDLVRFNLTNDAQLRAELTPGQEFATTDINLTLTEPPRHNLWLFVDNAGTESTGEWRGGATYLNRSLLGWRDELSLTASGAGGLESYAASYSLPFNRWGGRVSLAWYQDDTESKYGPLAPLGVTGESTLYALSLRQPVYLREQLQVTALAGGEKRRSRSWISGLFLQGTDTEDANLGVEVQRSDARGAWFGSYAYTSGHAEITGVEGRDHYGYGRGTLLRIHNFSRGWSFRGSLNFQHTNDNLLPSSEQFFIGGEYSVRGYPTGTYAGDQGYSINLELHHPLPIKGPGVMASGFFFFDNGYVKAFRPPNSLLRDYEEISGVGWGFNAAIAKRVHTRVAFAYALNDVPTESQRYYIHFQLVVSLL